MMNLGKEGQKAEERKEWGTMGNSGNVDSVVMETIQIVGLW